MHSDCCVPEPPSATNLVPDEIILYGVNLRAPSGDGVLFPFVERPAPPMLYRLRIDIMKNSEALTAADEVTMAMVYGYAFEGHCYRLEKPKILAFFHHGDEEEARGCGFEVGKPPNVYKMWRVRKKTDMMEMPISVGDAEQLLLEANNPGRRAPNTYSANMQMAHRGGRLTDVSR
jgi:hypothetical protein